MNAFEFVFSLFGLMLGFSLAEMLSGLVRVLKARKTLRIGWLTPLLAIFVMLDLTSFWANAWEIRESIPASYGVLVIGLVVSGLYYLAASLLFPERPEDHASLDEHFYLRRRQVLGGVGLCNATVLVAMGLAGSPQATSNDALVIHSFYYAMILLAALPKRRWLNGVGLILLIALYAMLAVVTLVSPTAGPA